MADTVSFSHNDAYPAARAQMPNGKFVVVGHLDVDPGAAVPKNSPSYKDAIANAKVAFPDAVVGDKISQFSFDTLSLDNSRAAKILQGRTASFRAFLDPGVERSLQSLKDSGIVFNDYDRAALKAVQADLKSHAGSAPSDPNYAKAMERLERMSVMVGNEPSTPANNVNAPANTAPAGAPPSIVPLPSGATTFAADNPQAQPVKPIEQILKETYQAKLDAFLGGLKAEQKTLYDEYQKVRVVGGMPKNPDGTTIRGQEAVTLKAQEGAAITKLSVKLDREQQQVFRDLRDMQRQIDRLDAAPAAAPQTPAPVAPPAAQTSPASVPPSVVPVPPASEVVKVSNPDTKPTVQPAVLKTETPATPAPEMRQFSYEMQQPGKYTFNQDVQDAQKAILEFKKMMKEKGVDVSKIDLGSFGNEHNGADGKFGKMTRDSVKEVQKILHDLDPNYKIDPGNKIDTHFIQELRDQMQKNSANPANAPAASAPAMAASKMPDDPVEFIQQMRKNLEGKPGVADALANYTESGLAGLTQKDRALLSEATGGEAGLQRFDQIYKQDQAYVQGQDVQELQKMVDAMRGSDGKAPSASIDQEPPAIEEIVVTGHQTPEEKSMADKLNQTAEGKAALANFVEGGWDKLDAKEKALIVDAAGGEENLKKMIQEQQREMLAQNDTSGEKDADAPAPKPNEYDETDRVFDNLSQTSEGQAIIAKINAEGIGALDAHEKELLADAGGDEMLRQYNQQQNAELMAEFGLPSMMVSLQGDPKANMSMLEDLVGADKMTLLRENEPSMDELAMGMDAGSFGPKVGALKV
jgi:hypothetical protein